MFNTRDSRLGVLSGAVACVLILALTVMALTAFERPHEHTFSINVSTSEMSSTIKPGF